MNGESHRLTKRVCRRLDPIDADRSLMTLRIRRYRSSQVRVPHRDDPVPVSVSVRSLTLCVRVHPHDGRGQLDNSLL